MMLTREEYLRRNPPKMTTFDEFTAACDITWTGASKTMRPEDEILYIAIAIAEESGEFAGKVKKLYRDDQYPLAPMTEEKRLAMLKELGDILHYADRAAKRLGSSLREVAEMNEEKIASRTLRGVRKGSGDDR